MFEDRSKTGYDFNKMDRQARIKVLVDEKKQDKNESLAHKKLFGELEKPNSEEIKASIKQEVIKHNEKVEPLNNMPSSAYLKSFEGKTIDSIEQPKIVTQIPQEQKSEVDFANLIETANSVKVNNANINKKLKTIAPKPKKNFSFRIKLVTGVYCILVALFGGWVIGNTINISQTNSSLYETTASTNEVNANILDILSDIKQLDNASSDPENETIVVKIVTEEIEITPETIQTPNNYETSSNWFDVFCNWIASLFGGK